MSAENIFNELDGRLNKAREKSGVPGCVAAVFHKGQYFEAAAGVINYKTNNPVTTDSIFQIGSITKSLTATLVMMLVAEGKLKLEDKITDHLPEFTLAEAGAANDISLRQLLCHVSGIDGDLMTDTGRGDDCIEKFVGLLNEAKLLHQPGQFFSYCNVGYIILGRILEVIEDMPFDHIMRNRLLNPLGLNHAVLSAEEALFFNTAIGHEMGAEGLSHAEAAYAPRSNMPSGTVLGMSARDLLNFARFHMDGGVTLDDQTLLDDAMLSQMRDVQIEIPLTNRYSSWGLGWMQYYWDGEDTFGHDGGWMGMSAYLRISPRNQFAAVLLANGPNASQLYDDIMNPLIEAGTGFKSPILPAPISQNVFDLSLYCGRYARNGQFIDIVLDGGKLKAKLGGEFMGDNVMNFDVGLYQKDSASCYIADYDKSISGYFLEFDQHGRPNYFHITERAFRRIRE